MESTLREYISRRKQSPSLLTVTLLYVTVRGYMIQRASVKVNNRRFTEFFDRYLHIPLPIVTKHELGLPFPLGTFP